MTLVSVGPGVCQPTPCACCWPGKRRLPNLLVVTWPAAAMLRAHSPVSRLARAPEALALSWLTTVLDCALHWFLIKPGSHSLYEEWHGERTVTSVTQIGRESTFPFAPSFQEIELVYALFSLEGPPCSAKSTLFSFSLLNISCPRTISLRSVSPLGIIFYFVFSSSLPLKRHPLSHQPTPSSFCTVERLTLT